jgi:hypothetical protein
MDETIAALREHIGRLEAALRRVEAWSFETATDLTDAGYDDWAPLLHGPQKPLSRAEALALVDELLAAARAQRGPVRH